MTFVSTCIIKWKDALSLSFCIARNLSDCFVERERERERGETLREWEKERQRDSARTWSSGYSLQVVVVPIPVVR